MTTQKKTPAAADWQSVNAFLAKLNKSRRHLSFQQYSTLAGQAKSGNLAAREKGLNNILHAKEKIKC